MLDIPAIDVHHPLIQLGRNPDGTLEVPSLEDVQVPGWDRYSPTPGQLGPSILAGHVDSAEQGDGIFYRLGALQKGDAVNITRADGTVAVFEITGVDTYAKSDFPTLTVYGNTDDAALRLITCGGTFDDRSNNYRDNVVAYGTLVDSHPAT